MSELQVIALGKDSCEPFPCIDGVWQYYSKKGIRTVFVSVGCSYSCAADMELAETLGCPITVVATSDEEEAKWNEVAEVVKNHARDDATAKYNFSEGAKDKWILSKNLRIGRVLPGWAGTAPFFNWAEDVCRATNVKDDVRIDIFKMSVAHDVEAPTLYSLMNAGLRPGLLMIQWSKMPDEDVPTSLVAGHLQMIGYRLIGKIENKFLYLYTDQDWYMTCSWEDSQTPNPLVAEVLRMARNSRSKAEGNGHARLQEPVASSGTAVTANQIETTEPKSESVQ